MIEATPAAEGSDDGKPNYGPAVVDGVIRYFSVTALQLGAACDRAYFHRYPLRLPGKKFKAHEIGTQVDREVKHYLTTGEDVLGDIARPLKPHLPAPGEGLLVNAKIEGAELSAAGIPLVGELDIFNARRIGEGIAKVTDVKTTSKEKYLAKGADLRTIDLDLLRRDPEAKNSGIQMVGYAVWALRQMPDVHTVDLEHVTALTTGKPRAFVASTCVSRAEAEAAWTRIDGLAERLKVVAKAKSLDEVAPNWNACGRYGGCPYQQQCLTHKARSRTVNILDRLKQPSAPTPPPAAPAPKIQIQDASNPTAPIKASGAKQGAKYRLLNGIIGTFVCNVAMGAKSYASFEIDANDGKPELIDIDTMVTPILVETTPAAQVPAPTIEAAVAQVIPPDAATPATVTATPPPAPAAEEKPKRGRKPRETPAQQIAQAAAEAQPQLYVDPVSTFDIAPPQPQLRVYVDAVPNTPAEPLAAYIANVCAAIEAEFKVGDIRLGVKDSGLDFGRWKGVLRDAIRHAPPAPGVYVILDTRGNEIVAEALAALETICAPGNFVRGVR